MKICGIYMIRHRESGKAYIGRSVDIHARWHGHRHDAFKRKTGNAIHRALRKYGAEAFDWLVLEEIEEMRLVEAEQRHIDTQKTVRPNGYNVGGTAGGFPSRALINAMCPDQRAYWEEVLARVSRAGTEALANKRKNPTYEKEYLAKKSAASSKREANIRAKKAVDAGYAAADLARRQNAARKNPRNNAVLASATFAKRMASDPIYAATIRENRAAAARARWAKHNATQETAHASVP